eukprot:scaffold71225_cov38-Cyclotella_meneghiniana.AAC.8
MRSIPVGGTVVACDSCEKCYPPDCLELGFRGEQNDCDWLGPCCAPPVCKKRDYDDGNDGYDDGPGDYNDGVGDYDDSFDDGVALDDLEGEKFMYSLLEYEDNGPVINTFKTKYASIKKPNVNLSQEELDLYWSNYGTVENETYGSGEYAYDLSGIRVPLLKKTRGDGYQGVRKRGDRFQAKFSAKINPVQFDVTLGSFASEKKAANVYSRWKHQKKKEATIKSTSTGAITKYIRVSNDA